MTEKLYQELDEAKAEIEKLISEYRVKTDLCDNLKRSNNDQLKRIQELNLKLEKQVQEVEAKTDEVNDVKQSLEDLKCKLKEKENVIKSSTCAVDKLRAEFNSKVQESEDEKRKLVSSLEEANAKISDLEHKNRAFMDKIEVLKEGIFSVSQKKCATESKMAKASEQMRERGDMFEKLEEEKVKLEEQLKWKNEQFKHLEEAHEKLKYNLRSKEKEWDNEKCTFLDNLSTLETKLASQITLSEVFKKRLEACKQALIHEEDRRKCLDIQLSESNSQLFDMKSQLETLTSEKECVYKEMECKIENLEEENRELVFSVKELKESKIREAADASTIVKLQNELKNLDEIHTVKEAEWNSRFEKMVAELNSFKLELQSKETRLKEITAELDNQNSMVLQLTGENLALKSTLLEARSKIDEESESHNVKEAEWSSQFEKMVAELNSCKLELQSKETCLKEITAELDNQNSMVLQLTGENLALSSTLLEARSKIDEESESHNVKEAEWRSRFEKKLAELNSCKLELQSKEILLKEITTELDNHSSMVLQLTLENLVLKSTILEARSKIDEEIENPEEQTKSEIMNLRELLEKANEELAECYCEVNEVEFELQIWKSVAEKLKVNLEVNHQMRKEVEASLLAQVAIEVNLKEELQEKERIINNLEEKIKDSKQNTRLRLVKENGEFEKDMETWEQEWVTKELEAAILAQLESERIHEDEKHSLNKLVEEKDERINNLQKTMSSLEEEFDNSTASFSSQLAKMQSEMNLFHEAWEKIRTTVVLKEIEVQEKDLVIIELEKDLENRVEFVKKCLLSVKKLTSENEKLMDIIGGASEWINTLSREDGQVMGTLRNIMLSFDENSAVGKGCLELKEQFDPLKENMNVYQSSPKRNMVENSGDERPPFRTING